MNEQQETQQAGGERASQGRCLCYDVLDHLRETLDVSPAVKQHLANSRIEFLKAIRGVIDDRIEKLSAKGQQGTKIAVE
jgi:hypothetical protein